MWVRVRAVMWHKAITENFPTTINKWNSTLNLHVTSGSALNDGQWHSVKLVSRRGHLTVAVDGDDGTFAHASPPFLVTTGSHLFFGGKSNTCVIPHYSDWFRVVSWVLFGWLSDVLSSGGCPAEGNSQECMNPFKAFQGCMRLLTVDSQPVDLIKLQQRLMGNYSHLQIDLCGITDRSDLNTPFVWWTTIYPGRLNIMLHAILLFIEEKFFLAHIILWIPNCVC